MKFAYPFIILVLVLSACSAPAAGNTGAVDVLVVETFLADITKNVAGDRLSVDSLIPAGLDPHAFEPTPRDVARISAAKVLVINGAGFEEWLQPVLANAGGSGLLIEASAGLTARQPQPGERPPDDHDHGAGDPHFWLDPLMVVQYVENIRDGLSQADPDGAETYRRNAAAYIEKLKELDGWIKTQVEQVPPERRLLVTNHESFGYYADRYGFRIAGTVVPSFSTSASPSARELSDLTERIRATGAPAIFLETGSSTQLADQLAAETGIRVITGLYTHSITAGQGEAATYLDMMRYNTNVIVSALK